MSSTSFSSNDAIRGALWMAGSSTMVAIAASCVRHLSADFSVFQLVFMRSLLGTLMITPWMIRMGMGGTLRTTRMPLYLLRTGLSYTGMICVFYGLANMPIGEVYSLLFLVPLITVVLAVLILGERATIQGWIACGIGFIGALIILRPGVIEMTLAAAAVLVTAVTYASTNICIKSISKTDSPVQITIYGNLLSLLVATIPTFFVWNMPDWKDIPWILALGLCYLLAGLFHARSVQAADARVVQPFNFLRLPVSVIIAFWLFAELPSAWTWLGAALIFAATYYSLYSETARKRKL